MAKKSMKLGGGGRFAKLAKKVGSNKLAAFIGRKKYGDNKMQSMAQKGKITKRRKQMSQSHAKLSIKGKKK